MISVKYQIFFFDKKANRENQLIAINPTFTSPSAISALLKTARFEDKEAVVFSGRPEDIDEFLTKVQRLDLTDWLDNSVEERKELLAEYAKKFHLTFFDISDLGENQVLGDPPYTEKELAEAWGVTLTAEETSCVEAAVKGIPPDLPAENKWLWDQIGKRYREKIRDLSGKDFDKREAAQRIIYYNCALKLNMIPFSHATKNKITFLREEIARDIEKGEELASALCDTWERHLKSDGTLKKVKVIKFFGSGYEEKKSRYYLMHHIDWSLGTDWKNLFEYLKKGHGFKVVSLDQLQMAVNKFTDIDITRQGMDVVVFITHWLTPQQAQTLTAKADIDSIVKMLNKYAKLWYKKGKFPSVKEL